MSCRVFASELSTSRLCLQDVRRHARSHSSEPSLLLQIARVGNHTTSFHVDVEVERVVSGRLYLDVMLSRRQVQRTLRSVEVVHSPCESAVNGHARVTWRDGEADAAITLCRNVGQRSDWIIPVVQRIVERVVERVSKEDPGADEESRTEPESVPEVMIEMASAKFAMVMKFTMVTRSAVTMEAIVAVCMAAIVRSATAIDSAAAATVVSAAAAMIDSAAAATVDSAAAATVDSATAAAVGATAAAVESATAATLAAGRLNRRCADGQGGKQNSR